MSGMSQAPEQQSADQSTSPESSVEEGQATVLGSAEDTEYAFDNSFTPALVQALANNPGLTVDEVLGLVASGSLVAGGGAATDNDGGLHHPTITKYGTDHDADECSDEKKQVAVLVANQNYVNINPLQTPIAEANTLSGALGGRGFDANVHADQSSAQMGTLYDAGVGQVEEGDELVAYYAGHGSEDGLCGINEDFPPNPPDTFTYAQVSTVVNAATSKGANIRFIMDSCHSGTGVQLVREERLGQLAENADSLGDALRVIALDAMTTARASLVEHVHDRAAALDALDGAIGQHQALQPAPGAPPEVQQRWQAILNGLRAARTATQVAFDAYADQLWAAMQPNLAVVALAIGAPQPPVQITDYRTLGGQLDAIDEIYEVCAQPLATGQEASS